MVSKHLCTNYINLLSQDHSQTKKMFIPIVTQDNTDKYMSDAMRVS